MYGLATLEERTSAPVAWTGLVDVEGLCDHCKKQRSLTIEHIPTKHWICRDCFRAYWREADRPAE
jgi:ribosomal protein L37AE/L43A